MARLYPLLQMPGVGTVHQHLFVVVCFDEQQPARFQLFSNQPGDNAEIGGMAVAPFNGFNGKPDRINGVMGCRKRVDEQVAEREGAAGFKFDDSHIFSGALADRCCLVG